MNFKLSIQRLTQTILSHPDKRVSELSIKVVEWLLKKAEHVHKHSVGGFQDPFHNNTLESLAEIADKLNHILVCSKPSNMYSLNCSQLDEFYRFMVAKEAIINEKSQIAKGVGAGFSAFISILTIVLGSVPSDIDETFKWVFFSIGLAALATAGILGVFVLKDDQEGLLKIIIELAKVLMHLASSSTVQNADSQELSQTRGTFFQDPIFVARISKSTRQLYQRVMTMEGYAEEKTNDVEMGKVSSQENTYPTNCYGLAYKE